MIDKEVTQNARWTLNHVETLLDEMRVERNEQGSPLSGDLPDKMSILLVSILAAEVIADQSTPEFSVAFAMELFHWSSRDFNAPMTAVRLLDWLEDNNEKSESYVEQILSGLRSYLQDPSVEHFQRAYKVAVEAVVETYGLLMKPAINEFTHPGHVLPLLNDAMTEAWFMRSDTDNFSDALKNTYVSVGASYAARHLILAGMSQWIAGGLFDDYLEDMPESYPALAWMMKYSETLPCPEMSSTLLLEIGSWFFTGLSDGVSKECAHLIVTLMNAGQESFSRAESLIAEGGSA